MTQLNLNTKGNEFFTSGSTVEYVGYYNILGTRYFTGRSFDETSVELTPIPSAIREYKSVKTVDTALVTAYIPVPTEKDYKQGWFVRYFARQANDPSALYTEIDEAQFGEVDGDAKPLYVGVNIRWKISGPEFDLVDALTLKVIEPGVFNTNDRSIRKLESTHPGLRFRLQNLTEFWKGQSTVTFGPALTRTLDGKLTYDK
jgi:hypothetical protein